MKKILSFILAALMTASCAAYVAADDAAVEETTSNAAQDYAIEFLANYGIFKGYSAEDTGADDDIQRYQMALFVSRISTGWVEDEKWEDGTANNATFKDIEEGAAANYLGAISYANQNGIIEGYTANTFAPYDNITYRDALTMVVRTLGYKGLTYPWGYIQKAVELELTEGIGSDVAYTDNLTRGEVATIIYNAMFANTAKGTTLAKSIFDIDFKWQNIIIVSTDEYAADGAFAKEGYVGFKTINEKAELGDKVYYVKSSELGLTGHEEELAVGSVFTALFEAVDGNFVTLVSSGSAKIAEAFNNGITDNAGKAYETMPIANALADYTLVKDYTNGVVNYTYNDLKVFGYKLEPVYSVDGNKTNVGIDVSNGNILQKNEDGTWTVAWYYDSLLEKYYDYTVTGTVNGKDQTIEINWMSDKEFTEWYNDVIKKVVASYESLQLLDDAASTMLKGAAPYAKLALFDIDNDGVAEIANYKDYAIGKFSTTTKKCAACNADKAAYKLTDLDDGNEKVIFVEDGHTNHDTDLQNGFAWVNVDPSVTTFVNEDGSYVGGVVLYNYNKSSGEIEIVKHIIAGEGDDADSYITTGILQAYNTANKTVTINGVTYPIAYKYLTGDMYHMDDTNALVNRTRVGQILDEQYMQYVTAVVCDGYVVDTDLLNETDNFIFVLGYAGVTSDGYIAVYGYSTADLTMKVFKINSFNGWKKGDYRYYPSNANEDKAFEPGALYQIKSYDDETQSYGVYTENVSSVLEGATPVQITFDRGYRVVTPMTVANGEWTATKDAEVTVTKMENADKYIVINNVDDVLNRNIFVYNGVVGATDDYGYMLTGYQINVGDSKVIVVYAPMDVEVVAFGDNAYEVGYVLYEKANGTVLNAAYDEAIAGDYYLLGSTMSEVRVLNLLTGNRDYTLASSNIDLLNGHIYKTIGGQIIADVTDVCGDDLHDFITKIAGAYHAEELKYADYRVGMIKDLTADSAADIDLAIALDLVDDTRDAINVKIADAMIDNSRTYYLVDGHKDVKDIYADHDGVITVEALAELAKDTSYKAYIIYDVNTKKTVIYVWVDDVTVAGTTAKKIDGTGATVESWDYNNDIKVEATLEADWAGVYNTETRDGKTTNVSATIDEIALYFDVDKLADHDDIAKAGYVFGILDEHGESHFGYNDSYIKVVDQKAAANFYYAAEWNMDTYECKTCDMVNYVSISGLNLTLDEDYDDVWVRFDVNGDNEDNDLVEGNNIEVVIHLVWENGVVKVYSNDEKSVEYDGSAHNIKEVRSIDLSLIH